MAMKNPKTTAKYREAIAKLSHQTKEERAPTQYRLYTPSFVDSPVLRTSESNAATRYVAIGSYSTTNLDLPGPAPEVDEEVQEWVQDALDKQEG